MKLDWIEIRFEGDTLMKELAANHLFKEYMCNRLDRDTSFTINSDDIE